MEQKDRTKASTPDGQTASRHNCYDNRAIREHYKHLREADKQASPEPRFQAGIRVEELIKELAR